MSTTKFTEEEKVSIRKECLSLAIRSKNSDGSDKTMETAIKEADMAYEFIINGKTD